MFPRLETTRRFTRRRPLMTFAFAMAATTSLLVAGCSTGGDDATSTTTTEVPETSTTSGSETTTTGGDDDATTTTAASGGQVSRDDLETLLPEAGDIGPDYSVASDDDDDDDDDSSNMDAAMEKACPEASQFMRDEDEDDDDAAIRVFETADGRKIEVKLDPTPNPNYAEDVMGGLIDAVNACSTIEVEQDGFTMTIDLQATPDDSYGDRGVLMQMAAVMVHPQLLAPLELDFSARSYVLGSVSVSVEASGGIDGDTAEDIHVVPGDHDLLDGLAAALEPGVADVQS